jgi:predicted RNase H-like nuclease (RuvC/YqgF family)
MKMDFENALQQEPVQAILMVIMTYTTESQRQIIYEKLGRRVAHPPPPADIVAEAEAVAQRRFDSNVADTVSIEVCIAYYKEAHISCAQSYLARCAEMGELLMTKDGEIESLKNDVAGLEQKVKGLEAENAALHEELQNWKDELKDQAREHRTNKH